MRCAEILEARECAEYQRFLRRGRELRDERLRIGGVLFHQGAVAGLTGQVGEQDGCLRSRGKIAELKQGFASLHELLGAGLVVVATASPEPQQEVRPLLVVLGRQVERLPGELHRLRKRAQRRGPVGSCDECASRALLQLLALGPRGTRQLERGDVVVGEHLGVLLAPAESLEPLRGGSMLLTACRRGIWPYATSRTRAWRNAYSLGARHRASPCPLHELLALERVESLVRAASGPAAEPGERCAPEHLPEHRGVLEQRLLLGRQRVEARGDDALHALRQRRARRQRPARRASARTARRTAGLPPARSSSAACVSAGSSGRSSSAQHEAPVSRPRAATSDSVVRVELAAAPRRTGARATPVARCTTTSSGTPLTQSTRWSMKSSSPSSAQWRSSNTSTVGLSSASPSRNRRQAANAL